VVCSFERLADAGRLKLLVVRQLPESDWVRNGMGAGMDINIRSDKGRWRSWNWLRQGMVSLAVMMVGAVLWSAAGSVVCRAQENPLGEVHTQPPPPPPKTPEDMKPVIEGGENAAKLATSRRDARIRVDVNLVLVPATVTDPMNRLVTGLEKENFELYDNNIGQTIKSFSTEDAPVTIGIIFDLSGSMNSKFTRARKALSEFLRTSNPQDER
jgi:Ca-activated chloride channel homolog